MPEKERLVGLYRNIISIWWLGWLLLASNIGDLSTEVIYITISSILAFYIGTIKTGLFDKLEIQTVYRDSNQKASRAGQAYLLFFIILAQFFLLSRSPVFSGDITAAFRSEYYESEYIGGPIIFVLYESFLIPIGVYLISSWVCSMKQIKLWIILMLTFFFLDALIKVGRFPLYFAMFFLLYAHLSGAHRFKLRNTFIILIGIISISVFFLFLRLSFVGQIDYKLLILVIEKAIINYHIIGFYILDIFLERSDLVHHSAIPLYTFGYFQYLASLLLRRVGVDIQYQQQDLNLALTEPINIEDLGVYNAFGTNLLPLYLDGGIILCIIGMYIIGFLLRTGIGNTSRTFSAINLIAVFVMIFGIFQPLINSGLFYIPVLLHYSIYLFSKLPTRIVK